MGASRIKSGYGFELAEKSQKTHPQDVQSPACCTNIIQHDVGLGLYGAACITVGTLKL